MVAIFCMNPELVGGEPVGYCTSMAENLDLRLPKTNSANSQGGTSIFGAFGLQVLRSKCLATLLL